MKFANPQFLWALFSLIIPILIHLFHFRRFKIVYFTNVRFLRELRKETQSRSRIRKLLILIARCLALSALVL
ncbi:MAG: BatA domain-containing protein, partial [Bacteroidetes bacterium]|nr:BatA domain-containing protein [Bacteroidota bacterium]